MVISKDGPINPNPKKCQTCVSIHNTLILVILQFCGECQSIFFAIKPTEYPSHGTEREIYLYIVIYV